MNPDQNRLDAIRKDYLAHKYPGNLSEMVDSELYLADRKATKPRLIGYAILAIAATILLSFGLSLWNSNTRGRQLANQPSKETIGTAETPPHSSSEPSIASKTKKLPTLSGSTFFHKNMVVTSRNQTRAQSGRRPQPSTDKSANTSTISSVKRKSSFWRTAANRLAKQPKANSDRNSDRTGASSGANKKKSNKNSRRHRWFKPSYEFKSITDPFYKYRRT